MATPLKPASPTPTAVLHPMFKECSFGNHSLYYKLWSGVKITSFVAIPCIASYATYLLLQFAKTNAKNYIKVLTCLSIYVLGSASSALGSIISDLAAKKIGHHQKKNQIQIKYTEIEKLEEEDFLNVLEKEISLSRTEISRLLTKVPKEKLISSVQKYLRYKAKLDKEEKNIKGAHSNQKDLLNDVQTKIMENRAGKDIEIAAESFFEETKDFVPTMLTSKVVRLVLKVKMAYMRAVFKSPGYAGNIKKDLLFFGLASFKNFSVGSLPYLKAISRDTVFPMIVSGFLLNNDPIAFKHAKSKQTITFKAVEWLVDNDKELESFLFSNPDRFTPKSASAPEHITFTNIHQAYPLSASEDRKREGRVHILLEP